jgi:hypothetical protein
MLCFTRPDFINLLNFTDLRAGELTLTIEGIPVAARELVSRFVSNTNVIMDRIDLKKLTARLSTGLGFTIEVEKTYPFHEVLIRPCIEASARHRFAYTPVLWVGRDVDLSPAGRGGGDLPVYCIVFEGRASGLPRLQLVALEHGQTLALEGLTLGALFWPNAEVQAEVANC